MMAITGVCRGARVEENKHGKFVYVGIAVNKVGGYPGEEVIYELQLTRQQVNDGHDRKFDALRDQMVSVPFWVSARAHKDRAYLSYHCSGDPIVSQSKAVEPLKKVG